ncbi:STAS domain-containing protein [Nocardioides sp. LML1-1-1.1]|uniref:STAS domain-containing protein n=1 Tax=Nocardioides sp. LML1-1-1.1 TaxID=3135248 RepID=UPI00341A3A04
MRPSATFQFTITAEVELSVGVVVVGGNLDVTTVALLGTAVDACLEARPHAVALDLRDVRFMDCAGTTELLRCRDRAAAHSARLRLSHLSGAVDRMLSPTLRKALAAEPGRRPGAQRMLRCLSCGARAPHVLGPTTRATDGAVLVQWWSCTACEEGTTVA